MELTVKEVRSILFGPEYKKTVEVHYNSEAYDITDPSPVQAAFDPYIVEDVSAPQPFHYCISLKRQYLTEGETA